MRIKSRLPEWMFWRPKRKWYELTDHEVSILAAICHTKAFEHVAHPEGNKKAEFGYRKLAQKLDGRPTGLG